MKHLIAHKEFGFGRIAWRQRLTTPDGDFAGEIRLYKGGKFQWKGRGNDSSPIRFSIAAAQHDAMAWAIEYQDRENRHIELENFKQLAREALA